MNAASLEVIDSALLSLSLDYEDPIGGERSDDAVNISLHAGHKHGAHRWFDKSIIIITSPSGYGGFSFEHSPFDGSTIVRTRVVVKQDRQ